MQKEIYMKMAVDLALDNVLRYNGGPFGAVVVQYGKVVGIGQNQVTANNDPTAHAEIQAIRAACQNLNTYQLTDCELYSSCEPCPMCLGASYWARLKAIYYSCNKEDASKVGFDDQYIYEQLALPINQRSIKMTQVLTPNYMLPLELWQSKDGKQTY